MLNKSKLMLSAHNKKIKIKRNRKRPMQLAIQIKFRKDKQSRKAISRLRSTSKRKIKS